jgi:RNA polymerase sigma factor (sigma-70 family)
MLARFASILTRASSPTGTDAELLVRFARHRDEAAFAALVDRHGPMVMGACRRILGDPHAAEDAFQAAFLVLARKAASLPRTEALAGWLYGVATRVALKARSAPPEPLPVREPEARCRDPLAELSGRELLTILEDEIRRLPAAYRLPVVLCCLEGLTLEEAASRLGCTTGALRGRLERGRVRLRARLSARGLAPATVMAVAGIPRVTMASTVSPGLRTLTAQAALNFISPAGTVSEGPRQLAQGVLHAMLTTTRIKLAAVLLFATALAVPVLLAGQNTPNNPPAAEEKAAPRQKGAGMIGTDEKPQEVPTGITVTGRVLSEPGGKGVAGVVVMLWNGSGGGRWAARTDEKGAYSFADVKPGDHYRVWIEERPQKEVGVWSEWAVVNFDSRSGRGDDLFLELPQSVSGTVTDVDTGSPVPGAVINFSTADRNRDSIQTDSNGRYRLFVPPREVDLYCNGTNLRYERSDQPHQVTVGDGKHLKEVDFKVKSSPPFTGLVVLPDGKPAKGVDVRVEMWWIPLKPGGQFDHGGYGRTFQFKTDDEGRFLGYMVGTLSRGGSREINLKAIARLPDHTLGGVVQAKTGAKAEYRLDPLQVVLAKTSGVMFRVVNPDGQPITDAKVMASDHYSWDSGVSGLVKHTGQGKYLMTGLIPGLEYHLSIEAAGYQRGTQPKELVLKPDEVREIGDIRLEWWGKKAVPGFIKKLQSADMYERESAAAQLGALGTDAADAVPALIEKLKKDPCNTVRYGAAAALGKIGPASKRAVPDLIRALQEDTGGGVQREAAIALGLIGDSSALPALKEAVNHSDRDVSRAAAEAIECVEAAVRRHRMTP